MSAAFPHFLGFDEPGRDRAAERARQDAGAAQARADRAAGKSWREMVRGHESSTDELWIAGYRQEVASLAASEGRGWDVYLLDCARIAERRAS